MNTEFLEPHQQRVVEEMNELSEKYSKLQEFRTTDFYKTLQDEDRRMLSYQLSHMKGYLNVLMARIYAFNKSVIQPTSEGEDLIGAFGMDNNDDVLAIKFAAIVLIDTIEDLVKNDPRRKAIAKTHVEEAAMMAVKGLFNK